MDLRSFPPYAENDVTPRRDPAVAMPTTVIRSAQSWPWDSSVVWAGRARASSRLTLLPLVGLAALVLVDVRRMIVPPRQQTG